MAKPNSRRFLVIDSAGQKKSDMQMSWKKMEGYRWTEREMLLSDYLDVLGAASDEGQRFQCVTDRGTLPSDKRVTPAIAGTTSTILINFQVKNRNNWKQCLPVNKTV